MAEFLGIYFLADIWPKFRGVEKGHQHRVFYGGVFGRNSTWRMRSATAALMMPAGG
jgi:hypothetical protein